MEIDPRRRRVAELMGKFPGASFQVVGPGLLYHGKREPPYDRFELNHDRWGPEGSPGVYLTSDPGWAACYTEETGTGRILRVTTSPGILRRITEADYARLGAATSLGSAEFDALPTGEQDRIVEDRMVAKHRLYAESREHGVNYTTTEEGLAEDVVAHAPGEDLVILGTHPDAEGLAPGYMVLED